MTFVFQQPGNARLLNEIDKAAVNADCGGGVFAFASRGGIDALFACSNITKMLISQKSFHLIVGIDAITNAEALLCLREKLQQFPEALTVNVFFHERPSSTFHPKFSWFRQGGSLRLLTGSGNMTLRGLGQVAANNLPSGNWEAFTVQLLEDGEAAAVNQQIDAWLVEQHGAGTLCSIDDERVRDRAMENGRARFPTGRARVRRPPPIPDGEPMPEVDAVPLDDVEFETLEVLVREIPKNRTGQADVGQAALTEFFGFEEGSAKNIIVQHVSNNNELESAREIRLFVNQSRNFRLELHAITDLEYEIARNDSRMLLIATKLDRRSFRYTVLPITAPDYLLVSAILGPIPGKRGRYRPMREKRVSVEELLAEWSDAPTNLLPVVQLTPEP